MGWSENWEVVDNPTGRWLTGSAAQSKWVNMENDPIIAIHCQSPGVGRRSDIVWLWQLFSFFRWLHFIYLVWTRMHQRHYWRSFWELKSKYFSKISHEKALKAQGLDISLPFSTTIACYTKDFSESTKRFRSQTYCYSRSDFNKAGLVFYTV